MLFLLKVHDKDLFTIQSPSQIFGKTDLTSLRTIGFAEKIDMYEERAKVYNDVLFKIFQEGSTGDPEDSFPLWRAALKVNLEDLPDAKFCSIGIEAAQELVAKGVLEDSNDLLNNIDNE